MRVIVQRRGVDESKMRSNEKRVKNEWNKKERERERKGERRQKNGKVMYNYRVITGRMLATT